MGTLFRSAVMNDLIAKHPMDGVRYTKPVRAVDDIKYLTVEEQEKFLEAASRSHNYAQYALILETGLRTGELIGLTWGRHRLGETDAHGQQDPGVPPQAGGLAGGAAEDTAELPDDPPHQQGL